MTAYQRCSPKTEVDVHNLSFHTEKRVHGHRPPPSTPAYTSSAHTRR